MKIDYNYDAEADAISVVISVKKADVTVELTEHLLADLTNDGKVVGFEILDASDEISKMFGRVVTREELKQLLFDISPQPRNQYILHFYNPKTKENANFLFPLYRSPIA